jgi:hypothetical protein
VHEVLVDGRQLGRQDLVQGLEDLGVAAHAAILARRRDRALIRVRVLRGCVSLALHDLADRREAPPTAIPGAGPAGDVAHARGASPDELADPAIADGVAMTDDHDTGDAKAIDNENQLRDRQDKNPSPIGYLRGAAPSWQLGQ